MVEIIVDPQWVEEHLSEGIVPVDARPEPFYRQAHLPGAVNLPVYVLAGTEGLPPRVEELASQLGQRGIDRTAHVLVYDDGASPNAATVLWALQYIGHQRVSLMDGGITRWRHEGRDWEYESVAPVPVEYQGAVVDPSVLARREDVMAALEAPDTVILDVRRPAEYLGLTVAAHRNGHVPGALNLDWTNNLQRAQSGVAELKPRDELRGMYEAAGVTPDREIIVHCQAGGRAAETYVVLKALGYPKVRNYTAGWQEWGNAADTPIEA